MIWSNISSQYFLLWKVEPHALASISYVSAPLDSRGKTTFFFFSFKLLLYFLFWVTRGEDLSGYIVLMLSLMASLSFIIIFVDPSKKQFLNLSDTRRDTIDFVNTVIT